MVIRESKASDLERVLDIWLTASIRAHDFMGPGFWESKLEDMRNLYIPAAQTSVAQIDGQVEGFCCLHVNQLAALFVAPNKQGAGIGSRLLQDAFTRRQFLELSVYESNGPSINFYRQHGFVATGERVDENTGQVELVMRWHR